MQMGKAQASQRPTALGTMLQASTYGLAIPTIYGMTQSPLLAIWANGLRKGAGLSSGKKLKSSGGKKGPPNYIEQIDFLLGANPMMGVMQVWYNGALYPLTFTSQTFTASGGRQDFTITDAHFYAVIGVTLTQDYSANFDDYGGFGSQSLSGSYEVPLWNELETGPDPTSPMSYRCWPFCYRWQPPGDVISIDAEAFPAGTLKVYYAQLMTATSFQPPMSRVRLSFESQLGNGSEYAGFTDQQIIYPQFAGVGSPNIDLGASGAIPAIKAEVRAKWGLYAAGDGDFADIIEDVVKSGLAQAELAASPANTQLEHGVSGYDLPGTIQKKTDSHASVAMPPMQYDMQNTPGNILVVQCAAPGTLEISSSQGESWVAAIGSPSGYQVWYATAIGGPNTVTITGASTPWNMAIYEIGGVGTDNAEVVNFGSPGLASGDIQVGVGVDPTMEGSGLGYLQFANFTLSGQLPSDAVIQGIYPVLVAEVSSGGNFFAGYGKNVPYGANPPRLGTGFTAPQAFGTTSGSVEFYGGSIGSSLASLEGYSINAAVSNTVLGNQAGTIHISAVGMAIYFTTAASVPAPPISAPFAVPSGQAVLYAMPSSAVAYAPNLYAPYFPPHFAPVQYFGNGTVSATVPSGASSSVGPGVSPYLTGSYVSSIPSLSGTAAVSSSGQASVVSSLTRGWDGFLMSLPYYSIGAPPNMEVEGWRLITPPNLFQNTPALIQSHGKIIRNPGTFTINEPGTPTQIVMLSLKAAGPANYPRPVGDFMDRASLDQVRLQCRANGLWGSLAMIAQQPAREWLKQLYQAANAAPVFSGFALKSIPYSEVSAAANGAIYTAPTAAGPVANLSTDNGDFLAAPGSPPITISRVARVDQPNVLQMQHINRNSNYQQVITAQPEAVSVALYGVRKADPITNNAVQDVGVARSLLAIAAKRQLLADRTYKFKLNAKWQMLEAMDLVTLTDAETGLNATPVRLTQIAEDENFELECEAEPFAYGMGNPTALAATAPVPYLPNTEQDPGSVNPLIIFEPVPPLIALQNQAQLWIVISGASVYYGGAQLYLSTDGGLSYTLVGVAQGNAITGSSTADWPAANSPDTVNDLALDLTESLGDLLSYQVSDEDAFKYPCYVEGGGQPIPYELMTYASATMTAANQYTLKATGTGNHLDRGVYGAPAMGVGFDHPLGSRFALLDPASTAIVKLNLPPAWIGVTLHFKACAFNTFGSALQTLSEATDYTYTPLGTSGSGPQLFQVNGA